MKTLKTIIACLILAISCVAFVGCNKDKDSDSKGSSNSIVGTWRSGENMYGDFTIYTFNADGTYSERSVSYNNNYDETWYGTYLFEPPYLTLYDEASSYPYTIRVTMNGNTMMMDGDVYYRQ